MILNQQQINGITWSMQERDVSVIIEGSEDWKLEMKNVRTNYSSKNSVTYLFFFKKIIIPLRQNLINMVIKYQCFNL